MATPPIKPGSVLGFRFYILVCSSKRAFPDGTVLEPGHRDWTDHLLTTNNDTLGLEGGVVCVMAVSVVLVERSNGKWRLKSFSRF